MSDNSILDQALALALTLSPKERLHLITQVASSVEREFISTPSETTHWGQQVDALLDQLDTSEWESMEMSDPTTWLKQQREEERQRRLGDWGAGQRRWVWLIRQSLSTICVKTWRQGHGLSLNPLRYSLHPASVCRRLGLPIYTDNQKDYLKLLPAELVIKPY